MPFSKDDPNINRKGRPHKGYSITEMMQKLIASKVRDEKSGKKVSVRKALGNAILKKALAGDMAAIKTVWQYMDGMPPQDITSGGEKINSLYDLFSRHGISTEEVPE